MKAHNAFTSLAEVNMLHMLELTAVPHRELSCDVLHRAVLVAHVHLRLPSASSDPAPMQRFVEASSVTTSVGAQHSPGLSLRVIS